MDCGLPRKAHPRKMQGNGQRIGNCARGSHGCSRVLRMLACLHARGSEFALQVLPARRHRVAQNSRTQCSQLLGRGSIHLHRGRRPRCVVAGFVLRGLAAGSSRANCLVIECDGYSERRLSSTRSTQHVYARDESGRLFIEMSLMKEGKTECAIVLRAHSMVIEVCERTVLSGFRVHSNIIKSEASVLLGLTAKPAEKLMLDRWRR